MDKKNCSQLNATDCHQIHFEDTWKLSSIGRKVIYCQTDAFTFITIPSLNYVFNFMFQNKNVNMEKLQISTMTNEETIELLKTDGVYVTVEEAKKILVFLYLIAGLVTSEKFNFEIILVD
ncbi:hypothetical protein EG344_23570 [Chryseobacterium sp. G0162]|uniref:hypothetical protein n=1 Tax=Chryseobacterium sp. G0162 TaxID=2487063 RepID=UPI000F4DAE76|nr:hypothetical protein [Chryseobacterium sp. G0162]AZB11592.1 hypothetical protein EG344_23570 [Chryseobacterium sp. G0162]